MKYFPLYLISAVVLTDIFNCRLIGNSYRHIEGITQGTTYAVIYENNLKKDYAREIDSILQKFENYFSIFDTTSLISRINHNDSTALLNDWFVFMFNKAKEVSENTNGAFDITVGPLVDAWGFGRTARPDIDSVKVATLVQLVGFNKVRISGNRILKDNPAIKINFNAIAQGFAVDCIVNFFEKENIQNFLIEIGGEVRVRGKNEEGNLWRIGIDKPLRGNNIPGEHLAYILTSGDKAVSTSGDYRNFREENGVNYSHTIDPHTGFPAKHNLHSVTVIANDCISADAYATAFMVLGLEEAKRHADKLNLDILLIYSDEKGIFHHYCSPHIKNFLQLSGSFQRN